MGVRAFVSECLAGSVPAPTQEGPSDKDLIELPPDDIHKLAKWLTEKVDSLVGTHCPARLTRLSSAKHCGILPRSAARYRLVSDPASWWSHELFCYLCCSVCNVAALLNWTVLWQSIQDAEKGMEEDFKLLDISEDGEHYQRMNILLAKHLEVR